MSHCSCGVRRRAVDGALLFGIPMGLVAAPISLSAWYLCKAMPLARTSALRIGATAARRGGRDGVAVGRSRAMVVAVAGAERLRHPVDR